MRRKHRKGELPDCIPGSKKLLWFKDDIMDYLKFGRSYQAVSFEVEQLLASHPRVKEMAVVSSCPGCEIQLIDSLLRNKLPVKVTHIMELLS